MNMEKICLKLKIGYGRKKNKFLKIITKPSQRGDHIVIIKIVIPTKLSEEEKRLYQRLYELNGGKKPQKSIMSKVKGVFK